MDKTEKTDRIAQPKECMQTAEARRIAYSVCEGTDGAERVSTVSDTTDEDLIREFRAGNRDAFRLLVIRNQDKVRSIILFTVNRSDLVDDIAQEVFIKVFRALGRFRFESKFSTWLYRITVNKCRDELRKMRWKRFIPVLGESFGGSAKMPDELKTTQEYDNTGEVIRDSLGLLPVKYREIIVLRDIEDNTYEEIAGILGCEIGTVKSRLSRARSALRGILKSKMRDLT